MSGPPPKKEKTLTLLQAVTSAGRVVRQGPLVQFIIDGNGAMVMPTLDFFTVEKWANSKFASGNRMADRTRFLDQIQTLVARPGSFISTRGSSKTLEDLARLMKANGYDLNEWQLPPELKNLGKPPPPEAAKKPGAAESGPPQKGAEPQPK